MHGCSHRDYIKAVDLSQWYIQGIISGRVQVITLVLALSETFPKLALCLLFVALSFLRKLTPGVVYAWRSGG